MADYAAIASAIAARFATATPPTGETLAACSATLPSQVGLTPALYVWVPPSASYQWGLSRMKYVELTYTARLLLSVEQDFGARMTRLAAWQAALENAIVGQMQLALAYVDWAELRTIGPGSVTYADVDYDALEIGIVVSVRETVAASA